MSATVNEVVEAEGLAEAIELVVVPFGNSYPSRDDPGAPYRTLSRCAREALVNEEVVRECAVKPSSSGGDPELSRRA